jgi:hypothetical protein
MAELTFGIRADVLCPGCEAGRSDCAAERTLDAVEGQQALVRALARYQVLHGGLT